MEQATRNTVVRSTSR